MVPRYHFLCTLPTCDSGHPLGINSPLCTRNMGLAVLEARCARSLADFDLARGLSPFAGVQLLPLHNIQHSRIASGSAWLSWLYSSMVSACMPGFMKCTHLLQTCHLLLSCKRVQNTLHLFLVIVIISIIASISIILYNKNNNKNNN